MASIAGRSRAGRPYVFRTHAGALADMFKALSDPVRLAILGLLRKGEMCECEIIDQMEMLPRELLSQHLAILHQQGLIKARQDDIKEHWTFYSLDKETLAELDRQCGQLFDTSNIAEKPEIASKECSTLLSGAAAVPAIGTS